MRSSGTLLWFAVFAVSAVAQAQTGSETTKPYATLDRQAVTYRGPPVSSESNLSANTAVIGMILPLKGEQQAEGKALLAAAQLAIEQEQIRGPLPDGRRLELAIRDESGPWGQASMEILKLFDQDNALAIVTSANGTSAHLAEQISNKISIPILTLSSDPSTTQANVPWLFRQGPSDADQARAFCQRIYSELGLHEVLLIAQENHDGRIGAAEFDKAAKEYNASQAVRFELTDQSSDFQPLHELLQSSHPDAIVIWTDASAAGAVIPLIRSIQPSVPIFLCQKAAQLHASTGCANPRDSQNSDALFSIDSPKSQQTPAQLNFQQLYFARTGKIAGLGVSEVYGAIHTIAIALRTTGANRVLLRDYLAKGKSPGSASVAPFDPAGNSLRQFAIVGVETLKP
jgi:ABC-type branched-subunit amino acid transport system substrate-binding protein